MDRIGQVFTVGLWSVKAGKEEAFRVAWEQFAEWTIKTQAGAIEGYLLQDMEDPRQFISFGPWKDRESIQAWRQQPEFKESFAKMKPLCDSIQPQTLKVVVQV